MTRLSEHAIHDLLRCEESGKRCWDTVEATVTCTGPSCGGVERRLVQKRRHAFFIHAKCISSLFGWLDLGLHVGY
jgi:hypothetical protein